MKFVILAGWFSVSVLLVGVSIYLIATTQTDRDVDVITTSYTATEEGFDPEPVDLPDYYVGGAMQYSLEALRDWERPSGPLRVGIQIGHFENDDVPDELAGLTNNGAGAVFGAFNERDTVEVIARLAAAQLQESGIEVDILPATVPPGYVADAFVSIHADGNQNQSVRGFKIAGPRRDYSGQSNALVAALYESYEATGLPIDPSISRRMTAYYAFNWPRYEHAIHPFTPAAIVETGFLTNAADRTFLLEQPEVAATAISDGIQTFLTANFPPERPPQLLLAPVLPLAGVVDCAPLRAERRLQASRPCEASLTTSDGVVYMLVSDPPLATSSLPYSAFVDGTYMPIQMLDTYFWFPYEATGVITVTAITSEEEGSDIVE